MTTSTMEPRTENWGAEAWRAPATEDGDTILFSEHGRVLGNVCYRSHYFRVVRGKYGSISLLVKHGGGQECLTDYLLGKILPALALLDSDNRYLTMYAIHQAYKKGNQAGIESTSNKYVSAFVEGRLRKRRLPKQHRVKVWIDALSVREDAQ